MKKNELREEGFSETTHYTKELISTTIWVISTLFIIAVTIVSSAGNILYRDNKILDFFHRAAYSIDEFFNTYAATSAIYLILWTLMMLTMYFIAKKPKQLKTSVMVVILIVLIVSVIFFFMLLASENYNNYEERQPAFFGLFDAILSWLYPNLGGMTIAIMVVLFECIYLGLKLGTTRIFCSNKNTIRFKFIHGMPVCYCTEAFRPWQTVAIYLVPFAFLNSVLYILNIRSENGHIVSTLFMAFITSFDLPAVIYALRFKVKDKADYVSIDQHIYEVTLYGK